MVIMVGIFDVEWAHLGHYLAIFCFVHVARLGIGNYAKILSKLCRGYVFNAGDGYSYIAMKSTMLHFPFSFSKW